MAGERSADGRHTPLTPVTLVVEYADAAELIDDYTANLSVGGTFVHTEREMDKGTPVDLILQFPGLLRPIQLSGVIAWSSTGDGESAGVGIQFTGHDELARARLQSIVDAISRGDPRFVGRVMNVLLVEDNPHIARLVRDGLRESSRRGFKTRIAFEFTTAEDGQEALDILEESTFDAMIVDMVLPVVDGATVISTARNDPRHAKTPVIAVSAGLGAEEAARLSGCHYFLQKPLRLRRLLEVMTQLIDDLNVHKRKK